ERVVALKAVEEGGESGLELAVAPYIERDSGAFCRSSEGLDFRKASAGDESFAVCLGVFDELWVVRGDADAFKYLDRMGRAPSDIVVQDRRQLGLLCRRESRLFEGGEGLLEVAHGVRAKLGLIQ